MKHRKLFLFIFLSCERWERDKMLHMFPIFIYALTNPSLWLIYSGISLYIIMHSGTWCWRSIHDLFRPLLCLVLLLITKCFTSWCTGSPFLRVLIFLIFWYLLSCSCRGTICPQFDSTWKLLLSTYIWSSLHW